MSKVRVIESKEQYLANLPSGMPIFYQGEFLDAVSPKWTAYCGIVDGELHWIWPGVKTRKYGLLNFSGGLFVHHNAPIILKNDLEDSLRFNVPEPAYLQFSDRHNYYGELSFLEKWLNIKRYYQYIPLDGFPSSPASLSKKLRRQIQKLDNLSVEREYDFSAFLSIIRLSYSRRSMEIPRKQEMKRAFEYLEESALDNYLFILRNDAGEILSGRWLCGFDDTVYAIQNGKNYDINSNGAMEYITWSNLQTLREKYDYFDFCGSSMSGVRKFNLKFGAEEKVYYYYRSMNFLPYALQKWVINSIILRNK